MKLTPVVVLLPLIVGCAEVYEPRPISTTVDDNTVISRTAAISNTYVLDRETKFITCSEPPPDAAFSQDQSGALAISFLNFGGNDEAAESEESEEVEMTGRTPGTLIAREIFFRTCEFSRNYRLSKEEAKELYLESLAAIASGWQAEARNTTVNIGESEGHTFNQTITGESPTVIPLDSIGSSDTDDDGYVFDDADDGDFDDFDGDTSDDF